MNRKQFVFPHILFNEIYRVAGLPSVTDLQQKKLLTAFPVVTSYDNFHSISQFECNCLQKTTTVCSKHGQKFTKFQRIIVVKVECISIIACLRRRQKTNLTKE